MIELEASCDQMVSQGFVCVFGTNFITADKLE